MEEEEEEEKIKLTGSQRNMNCFCFFLRKKIKNKVLVLLISLFVFLTQKSDFIDPASFFTSVKMKIIETLKSYLHNNKQTGIIRIKKIDI
jgi:hypothetical protein